MSPDWSCTVQLYTMEDAVKNIALHTVSIDQSIGLHPRKINAKEKIGWFVGYLALVP